MADRARACAAEGACAGGAHAGRGPAVARGDERYSAARGAFALWDRYAVAGRIASASEGPRLRDGRGGGAGRQGKQGSGDDATASVIGGVAAAYGAGARAARSRCECGIRESVAA